MPTINVTYILAIDSPDTTVNRVAGWLQGKNIPVELFCTQVLASHTRLIIICELDCYAIGLTSRRLRKVEGITDLQCLIPKQFSLRSTPPPILQLVHANQ